MGVFPRLGPGIEWFVVGTVVTLLWGNGAAEEGRTQWSEVFCGTMDECQVQADSEVERLTSYWEEQLLRHREELRHTRHGIQPQRYHGVRHITALCLPFDSEEKNESAFREGWRWMRGLRMDGEGDLVGSMWWEGPTGEVFGNEGESNTESR